LCCTPSATTSRAPGLVIRHPVSPFLKPQISLLERSLGPRCHRTRQPRRPRIWAAGLAPMTLLGTKIYAIVPTRLEFRRARINHRNQYRTEVVRTWSLDALCLRSKPCVIACHKHGGTRLSFCSGDSARLKLPSSSSAASRAQIK
jgi:hypothetical protein